MHIHLIAVGDRQPSWVDTAFDAYAARLPRQWQFRLVEIATADRKRFATAGDAKAAEGKKILRKVKPAEKLIVLDETGRQFSSREFAAMLDDWQSIGQDLAFVIGGPDGVSAGVLATSNPCWSLSKLTLPHGLARVLFAEQVYRSWSLLSGHPYHRD